MKTLLIAKGGGVYRTRAEARKSSAVGEQGETEGTILHLLERRDVRLVYFGKYLGEVPRGLTVVQPHLQDLNEMSTGAYQDECLAADVAELDEYAPFVGFVNVAGYSPTMSFINNPKQTTTQAACIRYTAPMLNAIQHFKLPRLVVNNDPRTYPKDQEMSMGWPWCVPAALLDQWAGTYSTVVGGVRYQRRSVYARAESWAVPDVFLGLEKTVPCTCVAHAHIYDGCKQRKREQSWHAVLDDPNMGWLVEHGFRLYGRGWARTPWSYLSPGVIKPDEVRAVLGQARYCPCVSAGSHFYTGKPWVLMAQECVPLLYGDGTDPYTWDPYGKMVPLDDPWRVTKPGDLSRLSKMGPDSQLERWRELLKPDFSLLDQMIDDLLDGETVGDDRWHELYGGYR